MRSESFRRAAISIVPWPSNTYQRNACRHLSGNFWTDRTHYGQFLGGDGDALGITLVKEIGGVRGKGRILADSAVAQPVHRRDWRRP